VVLAEHLVALVAVQMILLALRSRDLTGKATICRSGDVRRIGRGSASLQYAGEFVRRPTPCRGRIVSESGLGRGRNRAARRVAKHVQRWASSTPLPVAMLGEHSDEVLTEFGFTQAQIAELKAEAVIRGRET